MKDKTWIALIAGMLAIMLGAVVLFRARTGGHIANVYQDGACIASIDLAAVEEPYSFEIVDGDGHQNTVEVEPGRIRVSTANCPDQICVETGWLSGGVKPIVCLPAKLTIQLEQTPETNELDLDGVAG